MRNPSLWQSALHRALTRHREKCSMAAEWEGGYKNASAPRVARLTFGFYADESDRGQDDRRKRRCQWGWEQGKFWYSFTEPISGSFIQFWEVLENEWILVRWRRGKYGTSQDLRKNGILHYCGRRAQWELDFSSRAKKEGATCCSQKLRNVLSLRKK